MSGTISTGGSGAPGVTLISARAAPNGATEQRSYAERLPAWLRVSTIVALWAGAACEWTWRCLRTDRIDTSTVHDRVFGVLGWDLVTCWRAARVFASGGEPYSQVATGGRVFLYPPSALLLFRPLAPLTQHEVGVVGLVATALLAWGSVMLAAAALGRRWYGATAAVVTVALCWASPMTAELGLENVTIVCTVALSAFYLLWSRGHHDAAGVVIGLSLCVKPLLLPVLLVFLLGRSFRAFGLAVAVPAALNAIAFAVVRNPGEVWSKLPSVLNRTGSGVALNSAWVDVARSFSIPGPVTLLIRLLTVLVTVAAAWWSWRRLEGSVRLITTTSMLLIGTYLAGTLSENHYMLTLVPLAMTVVSRGAPMRFPTGWIGALFTMGLTTPGSWLGLGSEANQSAFRAFGMSLEALTVSVLLGAGLLAGRRLRSPTATEPPQDVRVAHP